MNTEFLEAIEQIGKEKGIDKETLMEAINAALILCI
jgi:N utilization substance protein A